MEVSSKMTEGVALQAKPGTPICFPVSRCCGDTDSFSPQCCQLPQGGSLLGGCLSVKLFYDKARPYPGRAFSLSKKSFKKKRNLPMRSKNLYGGKNTLIRASVDRREACSPDVILSKNSFFDSLKARPYPGRAFPLTSSAGRCILNLEERLNIRQGGGQDAQRIPRAGGPDETGDFAAFGGERPDGRGDCGTV